MLENVLVLFATLVGFAAFVSVLVNILKVVGVVQDDTADKWVAGFNLIGVLAVYALQMFQPDIDVVGIDATLAEIAAVASYILGYVTMVFGSRVTYIALKGIPLIGKSNSEPVG